MRIRTGVVLTGVLASVLLRSVARAEETPRKEKTRFEVSVAFEVNEPFLESAYVSRYAPPFSDRVLASSATQTLSLVARWAPGWTAAFSVLPREHWGIQVLASHSRSSLEGKSSPHQVSLRYIALLPPSYQPRELLFERSSPWPDPEGSMSTFSLAANALTRFRRGRLAGSLSGGLSFCRSTGNVESLGFTTFWLGGHSVLFLETYELELELKTPTQVGLNVGGTVDLFFLENTALSIDGRYYYSPSTEAEIRLARIVNIDEVIRLQSIEAIEAYIPLEPLPLDLSSIRIAIGLKFVF